MAAGRESGEFELIENAPALLQDLIVDMAPGFLNEPGMTFEGKGNGLYFLRSERFRYTADTNRRLIW